MWNSQFNMNVLKINDNFSYNNITGVVINKDIEVSDKYRKITKYLIYNRYINTLYNVSIETYINTVPETGEENTSYYINVLNTINLNNY